MRLLVAIGAIGTLAGCALFRCPKPAVVVLPPTVNCLPEPPPTPLPVAFLGPEAGCGEAFVGCLDVDGGLALERNLRASRRWQNEAWFRCGPRPDAGLPDGGS